MARKIRMCIYAGIMLVVLVIVGLLRIWKSPVDDNREVESMDDYEVVVAEYPSMATYPDESKLFDGSMKYEEYDVVLNEWRTSIQAQYRENGYADSLNNFWTESIRTFLSNSDGANKLYSPTNVYMALAMLAEITDGNSRQQILDVLGSENIETLRAQANDVWNAQYRNDGATTEILANSLWLSNNINYEKNTLESLASNYYASSFSGEMGSDDYNKCLRAWLNEQTGGMLKEQVNGIEMKPETVMALATTIYYRAKWCDQFSKASTSEDVFHGSKGDETVDFMHSSEADTYYWADKFAAYAKDMENGGGTMLFILPDEGVSVDEVLAQTQFAQFILNHSEYENQKRIIVNASIPKFDVNSNNDLVDVMIQMGITDVFNPSVSDFTPLTKDMTGITVNQASHGVRVSIDEEGVEAAAFTVMMMAGACMPPKEEVDFVLDRPFIFVLNSRDGLPLFVGVVNTIK